MRIKSMIMAGTLGVAVAACGPSIQVNSDWDPSVDFAQFETFFVLDVAPGQSGLSNFTIQRIKLAIRNAMTAKGMTEANNVRSADVSVGFQVATDQRSTFRTVSTGWSYSGWRRGGWGGRSMGTTSSRTTEQRYEVGSLIIAIANRNGDMVFQSSGSKALPSQNLAPDEAQDLWNRSASRILSDFPPGD